MLGKGKSKREKKITLSISDIEVYSDENSSNALSRFSESTSERSVSIKGSNDSVITHSSQKQENRKIDSCFNNFLILVINSGMSGKKLNKIEKLFENLTKLINRLNKYNLSKEFENIVKNLLDNIDDSLNQNVDMLNSSLEDIKNRYRCLFALYQFFSRENATEKSHKHTFEKSDNELILKQLSEDKINLITKINDESSETLRHTSKLKAIRVEHLFNDFKRAYMNCINTRLSNNYFKFIHQKMNEIHDSINSEDLIPQEKKAKQIRKVISKIKIVIDLINEFFSQYTLESSIRLQGKPKGPDKDHAKHRGKKSTLFAENNTPDSSREGISGRTSGTSNSSTAQEAVAELNRTDVYETLSKSRKK